MWNPRTWSQGVCDAVGSTKQHRVWTGISGSTCCLTGHLHVTELWCVPRLGQALVWRYCSPHVVSHEDSRSPLSRDSAATSPSPSCSHLAHVPLWPSNLTRLATTAGHVLGLGFWDGGDMRWRVRQHACAAKLVDVWQQMCWFGTWTWLRLT